MDQGLRNLHFNVRIPAELHREAANYSATKNMSLNEFVRLAIDFTLRKSTDPLKNIGEGINSEKVRKMRIFYYLYKAHT